MSMISRATSLIIVTPIIIMMFITRVASMITARSVMAFILRSMAFFLFTKYFLITTSFTFTNYFLITAPTFITITKNIIKRTIWFSIDVLQEHCNKALRNLEVG